MSVSVKETIAYYESRRQASLTMTMTKKMKKMMAMMTTMTRRMKRREMM